MAQGVGAGARGVPERGPSTSFGKRTEKKKPPCRASLIVPFSSSFDVCQKDRRGKLERIAPTWWLFQGGFLLRGVVVVGVVVSGRGMHMHMHVHMIIWLNHKSPELGLNLSGS